MATFSLASLGGLVSGLATWRTAALVLALLNAKSLLFVWHLRILYHALRNVRAINALPRFSRGATTTTTTTTPAIHPLFGTHAFSTRAPLLEIDYNRHQSNSTYFTDLDASRTGLVTALASP